MFKKLCDNLNLLMANARINASELARKTGIPASTIKKIRNGDSPNPTLTTLIPIAKNFSVTLSELVGDADMPTTTHQSLTCLPMLTWQNAHQWPCEHTAQSNIINEYSKNSFALTIHEDHWDGFPKDGVMIIDPAVAPDHRHYVLVHKNTNNTATLRQLFHDDDKVYLKPAALGFEVSQLTAEHRIIGTVVEVRKNFITNKL